MGGYFYFYGAGVLGGLRFACFELAGLFGGLIGLGFWLLYSGVSFAGVLDLICL